jgi:Double zinc ribbon
VSFQADERQADENALLPRGNQRDETMSEEKQKGNETVQAIRWRMRNEKFRFREDIRIIPGWVWGLAVALLVAGQVIAELLHRYTAHAGEPLLPMAGIALAASLGLSFFLLLIAYVNRDAKRRGMNPVLWTMLAIFVPYLIGLVIYLLVREPLPYTCPQCGTTVSARFNYCTKCKFNLRPTCPQCKREVGAGDAFCPYCAQELKTAEANS